MKIAYVFKKILIVSVIAVITAMSSYMYVHPSINKEIKNEIVVDQIIQNINLLTLNLAGYKNYQGDFKQQWDTQIAKISSIFNQNPELYTIVESDFAAFRNTFEGDIHTTSQDGTFKKKEAVLSLNKGYIERLLSRLNSFSNQAAIQQKNLKSKLNIFQVLLFITWLSIVLYYFHSYLRFYRRSLLLFENTLGKFENPEDVLSNRINIPNRSVGKDKTGINNLISRTQNLLQEKEIELQEKNSILNHLVKNLPIGLAVSSLNGKDIKLANKKFTQIPGAESSSLEEIRNSLNVFSDKQEFSSSIDIKQIPIPDQDLLISIIENNSEKLEKERELTANKRFSEVIFESNMVAFSLLDSNNRILKVNRRFCKICGYTEAELLGQSYSMLFKKGDSRNVFNHLGNINFSRKTAPIEHHIVGKNGEVREVLFKSESFVFHNSKRTLCSLMDISQTKMEKRHMMAAIDEGGLGTWRINNETGDIEINEQLANILGYKRFEILPSKEFFESLIHPEDLPLFKSSIDSVLQAKKTSFSNEIRFRCKNGEFKWVLSSGKPIKQIGQEKPNIIAGSHQDLDKVKKKELELTDTGDRLRRAQEMGMVGDWELELDSGILNCSAMVFRILGRKKNTSTLGLEEVIEQFHQNSGIKLRNAIKKLIKDKSSISMEADIFLPNGKIKHIKIIAVPLLGVKKEVHKVMGIFQDVSSIKIAQNRLQNTNTRLQLLSDNIPGGLIQLRVNGNLPPQVLYLSKGAEKIWNLTREEAFLGNGEHLFKNIHPRDHNYIKKSLKLASQKLERLSIIWRTFSKNGEITWHHGIGIPTKNPDNTITWNALVLDVTEKKSAENKLKEQEEYMQVLTQHASDAIIACDINGKIKFVNQTLKNWAGPTKPGIETKDWPQAYHLYSTEGDRFLKTSELSLFQALKTGKVYKQEFLIKKPGAAVRYVQSNGSALKDASGNPLGAMVVLRDITQKVQHEIEVSNAIIIAREKERSRIASEIHDGITQSLSVVAMNMKNLRYDYTQLESSESYTRALNYLNNVIDQSRSLAHTIMPNSIKDFGLIEAVRELVEQSGAGSNKEISFEHTSYRRIATGTELYIFRVIQEGLGNAVKHSDAKSIQIHLYFEENYVIGSIQDDGKGFDVNKSYHKQGIGLISMRDRIKKMKGQFRVFSRNGTVIYFKVPVKYKVEANEKNNTYSYS